MSLLLSTSAVLTSSTALDPETKDDDWLGQGLIVSMLRRTVRRQSRNRQGTEELQCALQVLVLFSTVLESIDLLRQFDKPSLPVFV